MARKLKKSVINSIPHLSENLNEEEKQRKLKQSVVESIPHLSDNLNNENYKRSLKQSAWDSDSNFDMKRYDDDEDIAPMSKYQVMAQSKQKSNKVKSGYKFTDFSSVISAEDFAENSGYKSTKNDKWWSSLTSQYGLSYDDLAYEYINNAELKRDEITKASLKFGNSTLPFEEKGYNHLTADEVKIYNYLYATGGKKKAEEYLEALEETLNTRKAEYEFGLIEGKTALEILNGINVGLDQFESGVKNFGNMLVGKDDYIAPTSAQILGGMIRQDLADDTMPLWYNFKDKQWEDEIFGATAGQFAYDSVTTASNMIPSIAASAASNMILPGSGIVVGGATMGSSSAGNAYQSALNEGYDKDAAKAYATSIGTLEALLQTALGGIGKLGGTSKYISKAVSGIDNALLRFSLEFGGRVGSEALEEGLQEVLDPILQNAILGADEDVNWEEVAYSALLGGVMGATMGGDSNNLSHSDQKVVNKVYEAELAKKKEDGKTLTKKEKSKIYDSVVERLEKGQIDIDTIESVLGGDTYKAYKETVDSEDALKTELAELRKMKSGDMNDLQTSRMNELKGMNLDDTTKRDGLRKNLDDVLSPMLKDSKLSESYRERERRGQAFEADLSKYTGKKREAVERAVKSGVLNNTYRSHELVELLSEIEAEKGITFNYSDNKRLKEAGYTYDGYVTNGFADKKTATVTLNVQSSKAWQSVVGHEITHVLETNPDAYNALRESLYAYAESRGELESKRAETIKLYEGKGADIEAELTADLVGDYLFTDKDFVSKLTGNRTLFQKIYDEIKYLWNVATGKEKTEIEKVKAEFDKAWERLKVGNAEDGKTDIVENPNISDTETILESDAAVETETVANNGTVEDAIKDIYAKNGWGDIESPVYVEAGNNKYEADIDDIATGILTQWDTEGSAEGNALHALLDENAEYDEYDALSNENRLHEIIKEKLQEVVPTLKEYPDGYVSFSPEEATLEAVKRINPSLYSAYMAEVNNGKAHQPMVNSVIDISDSVRQEIITPTEAAQLLSDTYNNRGIDGVTKLGYIRNAESYSRLLEYAKGDTTTADAPIKTEAPIVEEAPVANEKKKPKRKRKTSNKAIERLAKKASNKYMQGSFVKDGKQYISDGTFAVELNTVDETIPQAYAFPYADVKDVLIRTEKNSIAGNYTIDIDEVISAAKAAKGEEYFYNAVKVGDGLFDIKRVEAVLRSIENPEISLSKFGKDTPYKMLRIVGTNGNAIVAQLRNDGKSKVVYEATPIEKSGKVQYSISDSEGKTLYTGSPNTNIQQFKVGGVDGSKRSGDRYGRGVYLTTNENTAKGYAGDSGKVYEINADNLNIFNLNDPITEEMKATLQRELNGKDKQFRNSVLRNFRSEKAFTDFESAEQFFDEQRKLWKEEDGYYAANKPDIKSANDKTGEAVIEYTDFANIDNAIGNLTGNELYDALKSISTDDFASFITGHGFDGISFDEDADNQQYVIYRNEDRLNILNNDIAPSDDPDIRFSLSDSVEETKDLMALHNLQASELIKTLELGGLPMPSIAVIKDTMSHEEYGDVSLILPKEAIDPQANKDNKVYGGDAWTPTYPRIEYKPNEKVAKKIRDKYYGLANNIGYDEVRPLYNYVNDLENTLNRDGGESSMLQKLYEDTGMMNVYLQDSGRGKVETITHETVTKISEAEAEMHQFFIDALGYDFVAAMKAPEGVRQLTHTSAYLDQHDAEIREAYKRYFMEVHGFTQEEANNALINATKTDLMKIMLGAYRFTQNKGVTVKTETDYEATEKAIRAKAADGFREWVDGLFKGIEEKSGIRNNQDYYNRNGEPRSWNALHWENTLENVVKVMKGQDETGVGSFSPFNTLFGASHKRYDSIQDIKADSDRLGEIDQDEYDSMKDSFSERFAAIAASIKDPDERNQFIATDTAAEQIIEAVRTRKTKTGILNHLKSLNSSATMQTVDDVLSLVSDIANMPTGYFEAKPQRAVSLDEVGVFVIPRNADVKLKQELLNRGYSIAEYDPDVEGDRQKVVNQFEEYKFSLSKVGEEYAPVGTPFRELALNKDIESVFGNIAPVGEGVSEAPMQTDADGHPLPDEVAEAETVPLPESSEDIVKTVKERLNAKITNSTKQLEETKLLRDWVKASYENKIAKLQEKYDSKKNKETKVAVGIKRRIANLKRLAADLDTDLSKRISDIEERISKTAERMEDPPKKDILEVRYERINNQLEADKAALAEEYAKRKADAEKALADKPSYFKNKALALYEEVRGMRKGVKVSKELGYLLDNLDLSDAHKAESYKRLRQALIDIKNRPSQTVNQYSEIESIAREMINASYENDVYALDEQYQAEVEKLEADAEAQKKAIREQAEALRRADVQRQKLDEVNSILHSKGFDLDEMIDNPVRQLSTLETVDTMPQRVLEKTFGYEAGQALSDATVNKIAQNETEGVKWLDSVTNRKEGLLAQFVKEYNIKPDSKEVAAAQIYAEGSWVDEETGEEFAYGDAELAKDFPDVKVQNNIKALARDPRIRQFYDESLDSINVARKRNGYPEIPRLNNYYLHYREMGDFFTKFGLPFNPNDMKAKDLPTDMVGRTADLKPGQPFFTSSMHRKGKKTTYNLYEGIERYANMAKNQIYHLDDIQTLRALHYYLAERFGQAQGLENLNKLTPEAASEQIKKVYGSHLSTFAAFLDTEANILAGKTSMIDRALSEGMLGRRILTFMDALNKQTGAAMVGYGVSSANTNWLPAVQEFANANPVDSVKALAQTVANIASRGKFDSFREDSTVYIRRQGADRFNRKLWQKLQDPGYALMGAVDAIGTEIIARTEYNKAIREGMSAQEAHYESDKKVSRLMADRSLGQMPQMYTSRMLGLVTKFQLEVRNYLDSAFYDTLQEEKVAHKYIENALERNAKTAAKVAWRYGTTAIAMHMFGKAFESVAGYNPAFDIIEAITKAFGWDDDEDDEDTWRDNLGEGAMSLLEDLPYASIFLDGGRIPISSALPDFKGIITGKDEYGNEKSLGESFMEIAPYMLPAGGNQFKKTYQGLKMFSDDHPVTGSYTDSGSLRFPVEDTPLNRVQAALFGQYASKNAREYFDNGYAPLSEKQIQEYIDVDMPIKDYWEYREGLNDLAPLPGKKSVTLNQKGDYIGSLDLPTSKKNILINNIADRDTPIDMRRYDNYKNFEEFDFAQRFPEKYAVLRDQGISVEDYKKYHEESTFLYTDDYSWAADYPNKYTLSKVISDDVTEYKRYTSDLNEIKGENKKEDKRKYIFNLDIDYGAKCVLFKSQYKADDTYNYDIVNYINNRSDLSYDERVAILTELGFRVTADGQIYSD